MSFEGQTIYSVVGRATDQNANISAGFYNLLYTVEQSIYEIKNKVLPPDIKLPWPKGYTQGIPLPLFQFQPFL